MFINENINSNIHSLILKGSVFKDVMEVKDKLTKNLDNFEFGHATDTLYDKFWNTYCDIYIEEAKRYLNDETIDNEIKREICDLLIFTLKLTKVTNIEIIKINIYIILQKPLEALILIKNEL